MAEEANRRGSHEDVLFLLRSDVKVSSLRHAMQLMASDSDLEQVSI